MNRRTLFATLLAALSLTAVLLSISTPVAAFAASRDTSSATTLTICTGASIPHGWVITAERFDWTQCSPGSIPFLNASLNVEDIAAPFWQGDTMTVCSDSSLPSDAVIIADLPFVGQCVGEAYGIHRAHENVLTVCAISPIPDTYVQTGTTRVLWCGLGDNNAVTIAPQALTPGGSDPGGNGAGGTF